VTVKDQNGKEVFSRQKKYTVDYLRFAGGKQVPLANWDITAMEAFYLDLAAGETDTQTFIIPLAEGTKSVDVEASFIYEYEPGDRTTIHKVNKKVEFTKQ
jgi:hypothetical protein